MHEACDYTAGTDVFAGIKAGRLNISLVVIRRPAQMDPVSSRVWKICGPGEKHARVKTTHSR
jgi:hypothetical protein